MNTKLAYGVELNAAQRQKAAEINLRALDAQYPEPDPHENVDAWLVWCKGRLQTYGRGKGINVFVCNRFFKEVEQWARDSEDFVANCQWHAWYVLFRWKVNRSNLHQKQMLRQFAAEAAAKEADRTFRPSNMSERLKAYLMREYGLDKDVCNRIFINVTRYGKQTPQADPRIFMSNVVINAEHLKFNADGRYGKHWFASPDSNVPFLSSVMQLCFARSIEFEDRMALIRRALGDVKTPFEYTGKPVEALALCQALIDKEHPQIQGYYSGGFIPDSEAAALIPYPGSKLTDQEEADAYLGAKETTMSDWTLTDKNGPFWKEVNVILKHLSFKERSPFVFKVVREKFDKASPGEVDNPDDVLEAIRAAVPKTPKSEPKPDDDELTTQAPPPAGAIVVNSKPAEVDKPDIPLENFDEDTTEEIPSVVPGKSISPWLNSLKTLTGVEAMEIAYWLNRPYGKGVNDPAYYKPVKGPGGAKWTDLDPIAVRRRLCKVFGPQGIGWKIVATPRSETYTEAAMKGTLEATRCVMSNFSFMYATINDKSGEITWNEVGGLGASNVNADHKYAMHGASTGLLKRAMALLGGMDHFISGEE